MYRRWLRTLPPLSKTPRSPLAHRSFSSNHWVGHAVVSARRCLCLLRPHHIERSLVSAVQDEVWCRAVRHNETPVDQIILLNLGFNLRR
jgi:hypothetical protein